MNKAKIKAYGVMAFVTLVTLGVLNRLAPTNPVRKVVSGQ